MTLKDRPKIYILTPYRDNITLEMKFTVDKLQELGFNPKPIWLKSSFIKGKGRKGFDTSQVRARNKLIKQVPRDEWMLVMDDDEIPCFPKELIFALTKMVQQKIYVINILEINPLLQASYYPRIIYKFSDELEYKKYHDWIDYRGKNIIDATKGYQSDQAYFSNCKFLHFKTSNLTTVLEYKEFDE